MTTYASLINCSPLATSQGILTKVRDAFHKAMTGVDYPTAGSGGAAGMGVVYDQIVSNNRFFGRINTQQGTSYKDGFATVEIGIATNLLYMRLGDGFATTSNTTDSKGGATVSLKTPLAMRGSSNFLAPDSAPLVSPISALHTAFSGGAGIRFHDNNSLYNTISIADNASNFNFGTGDYTIRVKAMMAPGSNQLTIFDLRQPGASSQTLPTVIVDSNGSINFMILNSYRLSSANGAFTTGVYHDVELSRASGVYRLFLDGVQVGTTWTDASSLNAPVIRLGTYGYAIAHANGVFGSFDEFEVVKGIAVHTSGFTPPTTPTTSGASYWANLVCLCHFDDETGITFSNALCSPLNTYNTAVNTRFSNQVYLGEAFLVFAAGNPQGFWFAVKSAYGLQTPCAIFGPNRWSWDTVDLVADASIFARNATLRVLQIEALGNPYAHSPRLGGVRQCYSSSNDPGDAFLMTRKTILSNGTFAQDSAATTRRRNNAVGINWTASPSAALRGILRYDITSMEIGSSIIDGPVSHPFSLSKVFTSTDVGTFAFGESSIFGYTTGFIPNESVLPNSSSPEWISMNYASQSTDTTTGYSRVFAWALPVLFDVVS